jgi:hypothetical protein
MTLVERVVALLAAHDIPHALIGAAAMAARGIARSTYDIDLLVADARVLEPTLWKGLDAVEIEIRRGDADDPLGGVVRLDAPGERPVDIVLGKHPWQKRAVARAERFGEGTAVVAARDLVLLKLYAGGSQDLWDVRELLQLPDAAQLSAEVDADLADQPETMRERWDEVRR